MKEKIYKRITSFEREEISRGIAVGMSVRSIAQKLSRSPSTQLLSEK
ncbi:MAG TPA: helix-turn-helix domain-containing protein [Ignavibacteria bacterium]|nr:helix-turn-helix domain-containing protein [Ignavibacteria bacterium]